MILQPDLFVRDILRDAFVAYRGERVDAVREAFAGRPEVEVNDLIKYLSARPPIPVKLGYPRAAAELPGIYILLGAAREQYQTIGSGLHEDEMQGTLRAIETRGVLLGSTIHAMCWAADNADLTVSLQALGLHALLAAREFISSEGYDEQSISISDFEPLPQWFPDFAFRRDLALTVVHEASVATPWPLVHHVVARAHVGNPPDTTTVTIP